MITELRNTSANAPQTAASTATSVRLPGIVLPRLIDQASGAGSPSAIL
ncbi:MAG: hypothetical protein JNM85_10415 [Chthonomonas sp.]|nr:hypothetical protein [Chthonomonas sp.]